MKNEVKILLSIKLQGGTLQSTESGEVVIPDATQKIQLTMDAYNYMTSTESPEWYHGNFKGVKPWSKLSKEQRLEIHLKRMCDHFRGKSFSYKVLTD